MVLEYCVHAVEGGKCELCFTLNPLRSSDSVIIIVHKCSNEIVWPMEVVGTSFYANSELFYLPRVYAVVIETEGLFVDYYTFFCVYCWHLWPTCWTTINNDGLFSQLFLFFDSWVYQGNIYIANYSSNGYWWQNLYILC